MENLKKVRVENNSFKVAFLPESSSTTSKFTLPIICSLWARIMFSQEHDDKLTLKVYIFLTKQ